MLKKNSWLVVIGGFMGAVVAPQIVSVADCEFGVTSLTTVCRNTNTHCAPMPPCSQQGAVCNYCSGADSGLFHMECDGPLATQGCHLAPHCFGDNGCGYELLAYCTNIGTPEEPVWDCVSSGETETRCSRAYCEQVP